jgi:hypothetical protein
MASKMAGVWRRNRRRARLGVRKWRGMALAWQKLAAAIMAYQQRQPALSENQLSGMVKRQSA